MQKNNFLNAENFSDEVQKIFKIFLAQESDSIRLVGGCVRDLLLQKKVSDFDFATKFLPQEIIKILEKNNIKAIPTGLKHGTVTAVLNGKNFEITTLRKDNNCNGRHSEPEFIDDYREDALRRDFTINALYSDSLGQIHDYCDGLKDLKNQKVLFIGNAKERINEDYLRILRFFRFSCFYAKEFDQDAIQACIELKANIQKLSFERIRTEFFKILACEDKRSLFETLKILENSGIREEFLFVKLNITNLENFFILKEKFNFKSQNENILRLLVLILDFIDFDSLKELSRKLVLTNKEKKYYQFLLENFSQDLMKKNFLRDLLAISDKEFVADLSLLNLVKNYSQFDVDEVKNNFNFIKNFQLPDFPLQSSDLISLGFSGKNLGEKIMQAKKIWIESDFVLKKEELIKSLAS